ncbi:MAG: MarR family transcriptional regulator [Arcobacter sp.]|nr:MarR family transcriptional regulator [Arcobacter sp.]
MLVENGSRTHKSMKAIIKLEMLRTKIHNKIVRYLGEQGLTFNQFKVLEVLYHRGDFTIGELTELTISTPGNMTIVIRNLKKGDWVKSIKNPKDKRASIITITKKSEDIIKNIFPKHAEELSMCLNILEEKEIENLYRLLDKVYENMELEEKRESKLVGNV